MNPAKGYIGVPGRFKIAALCAKCHGNLDYMRRFNPQARIDQYAEYLTSVHGKKYAAGDPNVATCTDCHGAHGIGAVKDPTSTVYATNVAESCARCHSDRERMAPYKLPVNQMELYSRSVHGESLIKNRDISAPTCNDCHGNHGASPPGVDSVANACGQCHVSQWDLFNRSPHRQAFAEAEFPACVSCHQHHGVARTSDSMVGVEKGATCLDCHEAGSKGYQVASEMRSGILGLHGKLETAQQVLQRAERAGMEVSRPLFDLVEGRDRLVRARVEIHGFDLAAFRKVLAEGESIADASRLRGMQALEELAFRRKGLTVSAVIIVAMIGLLLLKIRQIDRTDSSETHRSASPGTS
jgi:predicted CXXCH cytochrome family protein